MFIFKSKAKKNVVFGLLTQGLMMAIGLIVPRLILVSYGSETNGLLSAVVQIFTYVGLLEAGIGAAALHALYKPFADGDREQISTVFSAAQKYFRKITVYYALCVAALSVGYPFLVDGDIPFIQISLVVFFQGLSGALTFYFVSAYLQVLKADGKNYVISNIHLVVYVLTSAVKVVLMTLGYNIVVLQIGYCAVHVTQILIFRRVMQKSYPYLRYHKNADINLLSERKSLMVHEFSAMVFSSTDMLVLSTFCTLAITSVYSVYNLVFAALNTLINAVNTGLMYILGQSYAKDRETGRYETVHDMYDSLYMCCVFAIFTTAYVLICPFVAMYTKGIEDIRYVDYALPILFVSIQLLSCARAVSARLIAFSGHAKATKNRALFEAILNLSVSILLVNVIGIYGVLIGTVIALFYRTNDIILYANRKILMRSAKKTYLKFAANIGVFLVFFALERAVRGYLAQSCRTAVSFCIWGASVLTLSAAAYFSAALLTNRELRKKMLSKVFEK